MRTLLSFAPCAVLLLHGPLLSAQGDSAQGVFQVDLAVPESPAFVLIGGTPSNLLRPTLMRDFAAGLSNFTGDDGGIAAPQNLGVELAPALLFFGRRLSLNGYRKAPVLYRLQASAAINTATHSDAPNQLAFGVRTSLLNATDPRMDREYERGIDSLADRIHEIGIRLLDNREGAIQTNEVDPSDDDVPGSARTEDTVNIVTCRADTPDPSVTTCVVTVAIPADPLSVLVPLERQRERLREAVRERRRQWEDEHWNAPSLDVAAGTRVANRDSLGNDPAVAGVALWLASGYPLGGWGHLLLGGSTGWERNVTTDHLQPRSSVSSRIYVGENAHRGFIDGERRFNDPGRSGLVNIGGELRLRNSVWATFSAGVMFRPDGEKNRLVTGFTVRAAGP